jgi:hypothetical protein
MDCYIREVPLDGEYACGSYLWEEGPATVSIFVNKTIFRVWRNLYDFVRIGWKTVYGAKVFARRRVALVDSTLQKWLYLLPQSRGT